MGTLKISHLDCFALSERNFGLLSPVFRLLLFVFFHPLTQNLFCRVPGCFLIA